MKNDSWVIKTNLTVSKRSYGHGSPTYVITVQDQNVGFNSLGLPDAAVSAIEGGYVPGFLIELINFSRMYSNSPQTQSQ